MDQILGATNPRVGRRVQTIDEGAIEFNPNGLAALHLARRDVESRVVVGEGRVGPRTHRDTHTHTHTHIRLGVRARDVAQRIFRKEVKWIGGLNASSNPRDGPSGQSPGFTPGTQTSTGSDYGDEVFKGRCLSRFVLSDLPSQSSGRTCVFLHFYFILFFSAIAVGDGVDVFMSMGIDFGNIFIILF